MDEKDTKAEEFTNILSTFNELSNEIELEYLFEKIITIVIRDTGAQKGVLILKKNRQFQIVARIDAEKKVYKDFKPVPAQISEYVPHSIIDDVIEASETLILGNAAGESKFGSDSYINKNKPKSILCMPIVKETKVIGILYLENNQNNNHFTHRHKELLDKLSSQIIISTENAFRFDELRKEIEERKNAETALTKALSVIQKLKEKLQDENLYLQQEVKLVHNYEDIIGDSDAVKNVLKKVEQVADTETTVLIFGETGTGKELLAHALHNFSSRRERTLVKVNCAALPSNLIESELFGHEKGAFTGAFSSQKGRFEIADRGTIFLDEIGELSPELQVKLLRVLQEGQFERLGSSNTIKVDVRVIAATNRNLSEEVKKGSFRKDLYYRLNVFPINVPPLRQRRDDIPSLVWSFVNEFSKKMMKQINSIPKKSMDALMDYSWPGNVRELRNVVERAVILTPGNTLLVEIPRSTDTSALHNQTLEEVEKKHILEILEMTGWRVRGKNGAAEILGLKPTTLDSRMLKLGIQRSN
jgi:Nif-specific regulatory protein